ncbi:hypothetical protein DV735_g3636, partial [Chaetothyriales sp. CBS 134920]
MAAVPSSIHGILHFTTEPLWAAAFLMRQLQATKFEYPFREKETPMQYGYKLVGEDRFATEHTYSIMAMQGRMPSFNRFMEGKFGSFGTMPERAKRLGYDLDAVLLRNDSEIAVVDIGGGRGEMLLEVKRAYPRLTKQSLILQDYHPELVNAEELTVMNWNFKDNDSPQPIQGALVYSLTHIYHNLSDLEALRLMKKIAAAMAPHSRMLIHEFSKNATYGKMHATMIELGTSVFIGCWVLTGFVFLVLAFRYAVKAWVAWLLPTVSKPERVWGLEDLFYGLGYAFDVVHMVFIWKSHQWGLGRHFYYLSPVQRNLSMKYDFISQPLAVAAAMLSRTAVIIFLYSCFAQNRKSLRIIVLVCLVVQIVVNLFTILQIILQCGPNPYRLVNRVSYFHYMWDPLPTDGSVKCQAPEIQVSIGYTQGAFNTIIDFALTYLAGFELWQFLLRHNNSVQCASMYKKFTRLESRVRNQRLWQTALLCGPLLLSGIASIVKTYLLSAVGNRLDFTWNIVPFVLWVKIEDYCIPIATTVSIMRLFIRSFVDKRGADNVYGSGGGAGAGARSGNGIELGSCSKSRRHTLHGTENAEGISERACSESLDACGSEKELVGGIVVKQEYEVRVENEKRQ